MGRNSDIRILGGETPFEMALRAVADADPEEARRIEEAISEGRLSIQDIIGFVNTKKALR